MDDTQSDRPSSYAVGRWIGAHPWLTAAGILGVTGFLLINRPSPGAPQPPQSTPSQAELQAAAAAQAEKERAEAEALRQRCISEAMPLAERESKAGKMMAARATLSPCKEILTDPKQAAFVAKVTAGAEREEARNRARVEAELKARKKREGVHIGMSKQDVLDSSWGRPQEINRSTYSFGVHEQWVYGNGNYLYFKDGTLTAIQN